VDEEYVMVTRQLRDTALELLRVQLKQAHPTRNDAAIAGLLAERTSGEEEEGEEGGTVWNVRSRVRLDAACVQLVRMNREE
jgi:predicted RecB family endonuclease